MRGEHEKKGERSAPVPIVETELSSLLKSLSGPVENNSSEVSKDFGVRRSRLRWRRQTIKNYKILRKR